MDFDWNNLIFLAEYLKTNCDDLNSDECIDREATFRTVINRAYYAAFNVASQFALTEFGKLSEGDGGNHFRLIKTFQDFKDENIKYENIAVKLNRIKGHRVSADYKKEFLNGPPSYAATVTMRTSQDIISSINSIQGTIT